MLESLDRPVRCEPEWCALWAAVRRQPQQGACACDAAPGYRPRAGSALRLALVAARRLRSVPVCVGCAPLPNPSSPLPSAPCRCVPGRFPDKKDSLIADFENYLRILKAVRNRVEPGCAAFRLGAFQPRLASLTCERLRILEAVRPCCRKLAGHVASWAGFRSVACCCCCCAALAWRRLREARPGGEGYRGMASVVPSQLLLPCLPPPRSATRVPTCRRRPPRPPPSCRPPPRATWGALMPLCLHFASLASKGGAWAKGLRIPHVRRFWLLWLAIALSPLISL